MIGEAEQRTKKTRVFSKPADTVPSFLQKTYEILEVPCLIASAALESYVGRHCELERERKIVRCEEREGLFRSSPTQILQACQFHVFRAATQYV